MYLQVQACGSECVAVDTISRLNVRGSLLASSGTKSSGKIWCLVSGIWYLGSMAAALSSIQWHKELREDLSSGIWYLVSGIWYLVSGIW